jgi:hypothetical protein
LKQQWRLHGLRKKETVMAFGDDNQNPASGLEEADQEFGVCCQELKEAIGGEEFEPLIAVGDDGILYMSIGMVELEDDEPGMVDHPVFFCPFCGTELQTEDEVAAKADADDDEDFDDEETDTADGSGGQPGGSSGLH